MMTHDPGAIDHVAAYFGTTPIIIDLWICAIAVVVIAGVGWACIELSATPTPEGERKR